MSGKKTLSPSGFCRIPKSNNYGFIHIKLVMDMKITEENKTVENTNVIQRVFTV